MEVPNLSFRPWNLGSITFLALSLVSPFVATYLFTSWRASYAIKIANNTAPGLKRPPTLPYAVPFIGHVYQFMRDGNKFMSSTAKYFGRAVPIRIILPIFSNYVVSGPEAVATYFKESRDLSTTSRSITIMEHAFGCPKHALDLFKPQTPTAGARPEDSIEFIIHRAVNTSLSGSLLDELTSRFQKYFIEQNIADRTIQDEWLEFPDLNSFVEKRVFEGAVRSMFGTHILNVNPALADDFWTFNKHIGALFMGLPRWLNPKAYNARDKMVEHIKRWQKYAAEHCDLDAVGDAEWEPYYGSKFIRERHELLTRRGIMDETARASEIFAFMWATNSNSMPAATWFLLEILQDPTLKSRVLDVLSSVTLTSLGTPSTQVTFDVPKLCNDVLLQSMYAETLRLRVAALVMRQPAKDNFSFRGWHIKKEEVISLSTRTEAMNDEVWSTAHPLTTFYADRFIVDPAKPISGPLRAQKKKKVNGPYFTMDGLSSSWIPYGGGMSLCPGRHFAKREIITTAAILLTQYDIELLGNERPECDMGCFGFGTMPPNKEVRFRIRKRQV